LFFIAILNTILIKDLFIAISSHKYQDEEYWSCDWFCNKIQNVNMSCMGLWVNWTTGKPKRWRFCRNSYKSVWTFFNGGVVMIVMVWQLDWQLPVKSVPITTKVVSSNPVLGKMYSIQHFVKKFVSDLWQVDCFLWALRFSPLIKLTNTI